MARDLNQFIANLTKLEEELRKQGPRIATEIAAAHIGLAVRRIQKEGLPGKSYSTSQMFATESMFNRKDRFKPTEVATELGRDAFGKLVKGGVRNKKGEVARKGRKKRVLWIKFPKARKAVPVMILPGGYKQLRQLNGLQNAKVDLTFSGRMFQNVKVLKPARKADQYFAIIGVDNPENKGKFAGNAKKYGDFMAPTSKEVPILQEIPQETILKIIEKTLG